MSTIINADTSDGLKFTSDTSGEIKLQSAGADTVTVKSDGKVGIGTSSPVRPLQVGSYGSGNGEIALASATTGYGSVLFGDAETGTDLYRGYVQYNHSSDAMIFATSALERMRIDSSGTFYMNSGYGSAARAYGCRAWVNFQGTGTVTVRSSGNVSSITDEGTGQYLVNFTIAMTDANYSVTGSCSYDNGTGMTDFSAGTQGTTYCRVISHDIAGGTKYDPYAMNVAVFR